MNQINILDYHVDFKQLTIVPKETFDESNILLKNLTVSKFRNLINFL